MGICRTFTCSKTLRPRKRSLRSRRLEVVSTRKNGRARRRHVRVSLARARSLFRPLLPSACYACLPRALPFSLSPATSKRLLRRLAKTWLSIRNRIFSSTSIPLWWSKFIQKISIVPHGRNFSYATLPSGFSKIGSQNGPPSPWEIPFLSHPLEILSFIVQTKNKQFL